MERMQIRLALDYIEEHLKDELDNKILAQISGYSEYHFIRVFRKHIHLTPADYIRKRRISEIAVSGSKTAQCRILLLNTDLTPKKTSLVPLKMNTTFSPLSGKQQIVV